ncbi:NAD(P)H:quinone oxidoreductase [Gammaproteobacteria bacterium]|nr:NAD(P)H:quinone oxidoreductase [Gammaproteobacteria bacterium]
MMNVLIIYYSTNGSTKKMARLIARGVEMIEGVSSVIRTVTNISDGNSTNTDAIVDKSDLDKCDGIVIGSPTHFGNMSGSMKAFIDTTTAEWFNGSLTGKPGGVFTSTSSMHGGQESTLLSMMLPLLHHGVIITGVPYSEKKLSTTKRGGTPYGPSHVSFESDVEITDDEKEICINFGKRIAALVKKLH